MSEAKVEKWKQHFVGQEQIDLTLDGYQALRLRHPAFQRRKSDNHVDKLRIGIMKSQHIPRPIVVNERKDGVWLVDGLHRLEAIRLLLEQKKVSYFPIRMDKYKGLSDDEMRSLYYWLNIQKITSNNDLMHAEWGTFAFADDLLHFPIAVTPYGSKRLMPAWRFLQTWYVAEEHTTVAGTVRFESVRNWMGVLDRAQIEEMRAFCAMYVMVFGEYSPQSPYYRSAVWQVFVFMYWKNKERFSLDEVQKAFQRFVGWDVLITASTSGTHEVTARFAQDAVAHLNRQRGGSARKQWVLNVREGVGE